MVGKGCICCNFVWNDVNANGVQDANEPGIDGIQVELYNCTGSRLAQTVTSGGERYQFNNLAAGCYRVRFVNISDTFAASPADQGGDDTRDSDSIVLFSVTPGIFSRKTLDINLAAGENNLNVDQGLYRPATMSDTVFNDTNRNGVQDAGEPGAPEEVITGWRRHGATVQTYQFPAEWQLIHDYGPGAGGAGLSAVDCMDRTKIRIFIRSSRLT